MPRTNPLSEDELFQASCRLQELSDLEQFNSEVALMLRTLTDTRSTMVWHVSTGRLEYSGIGWEDRLDRVDIYDVYARIFRTSVPALTPTHMRVNHIARYYEAIPAMKQMYEEVWSKIGCDYQLGIVLLESDLFAGVAIAAQSIEDGDFTDHDLATASALQPYIEQAYHRCAGLSREKWFGPVLAHSIEDHPSALFVVSGHDCEPRYANLAARRLMQNEAPPEEGQRLSLTLESKYFESVRAAALEPIRRVGALERMQVIELGDWKRLNLSDVRLIIVDPVVQDESQRLTSRQRQVLHAAAGSHAAAEAADKLGIATATLQTHLKDIYRRLEVGSLNEAVAMVALGRS